MAVRFPREGNPHWPCPPDYPTLTAEGRSLARRNVVMLRETPEDDVVSWLFFRDYYLNHEDAYFYDAYVPMAPGHLEWTWACAAHSRVMLGAHRGSAKSTIFGGEYTLRDLLAIPYSKTVLILSSKEKVERRFDELMRQIENNPRILEDFGELRPGRNEGMWNHSTLILKNGARLFGFSIGATSLRGERPHRILVDDPEYDPREGTNIERMVTDMDRTLFKVLLPMLRRGAKLHWIGTPIHKRMFLWRIINGELQDPRIDPSMWFRKIYPGVDSGGTAFWPSENTPEEIERKRRELGRDFNSEFLCVPKSGEEAPLQVDPDLNGYELLDGEDPLLAGNPIESSSVVAWRDCIREPTGDLKIIKRQGTVRELLLPMTRIITVDPCRVPGPTSDWAAMLVAGVDRLGAIWVLDCCAVKLRYRGLCNLLWSYVERWRPRVIGVESIAMEMEMLAQVQETREDFAQRFGWAPQIMPIRYESGIKKEDRIQGLEWRFGRGLVKLPLWRRGVSHRVCPSAHPNATALLLQQIEDFTPDLASLEHDDLVDALAMTQEIVKVRRTFKEEAKAPSTIVDFIRNRGLYLMPGVPVAAGLDWRNVPRDIVEKFMGTPEDPDDGRPRRNWEAITL